MTFTPQEIRQSKIQLLKQMHQFIINMGDEIIYTKWTMGYVPDRPDKEDFEFIVDDPEFWNDTCSAFGKFTQKIWDH